MSLLDTDDTIYAMEFKYSKKPEYDQHGTH